VEGSAKVEKNPPGKKKTRHAREKGEEGRIRCGGRLAEVKRRGEERGSWAGGGGAFSTRKKRSPRLLGMTGVKEERERLGDGTG